MLAVSEPSFSPLHSRSLISALNLHSTCLFSRPFLYVCCSNLSFICSFSHPCLIYFRQSLIRAFVSWLIYSFVRSLLTPVIHSLNRSGVCPSFLHLLTGTTMNNWTNEWMTVTTAKLVNEWMEWDINKWRKGAMEEWMNESQNRWTNEKINERWKVTDCSIRFWSVSHLLRQLSICTLFCSITPYIE